jgi:hypothetical protein
VRRRVVVVVAGDLVARAGPARARFTTVGYGAGERVAGGGHPYRLDTESARAFPNDYLALP